MERRSRIFPKAELVHFPRKGPQNKTPTVLLPCPPHRISPLWEQSIKSRAEQMPHLSHQARVHETSPSHSRIAKRSSSTQVLKHLTTASQLPHTDPKTMAVPLPSLHHRGLTKLAPRYKHRALASVMPLPRSNFRTKKSSLKSTADKQCLMPLSDYKNQPDSLLDPEQQGSGHSGPDHLPKIFPGYKNRPEANTQLNQKNSSPPSSALKTEVITHEGDKTNPSCESRQCLESTPVPQTSRQQAKASLRHRRHQVRAATILLGFTKKGDRPIVSTSSRCLQEWSKVTALKPPELEMLKESHSDLCPMELLSLLRCIEPESRSLTPSSSCHDQRTNSTTIPSPEQQADCIQVLTDQETVPMEVEPWKETPSPREDHQATDVARQDHGTTPLLSLKLQDPTQSSPEFQTTSTSLSEAEDLPDPSIHFTLQAEQDQWEKVAEGMEHQALIPAGKENKTIYLPTVPQNISPEQWVKLPPSLPQTEATQCLFAHISIQTEQGPFSHASIQTEQDTWQTMSSRIDHQDTVSPTPDHGATPPLDLNPETTLPELNQKTTATQGQEHQEVENMVDINSPVTLPAGQDHLGVVAGELDKDQSVAFKGQDHGPLDMEPQENKTLPDSDFQTTTLTGQDPETKPSMALAPQNKILPEPLQQATSPTSPYPLAKETGHPTCVSAQEEIMLNTDQQSLPLKGQDHEEASLLGLDSKDKLQPGLNHQAKDIPGPNIQLTLQSELDPQEEVEQGTNQQTTLLTGQGTRATPPLNLNSQDKSLPASDSSVTTPSHQENEITPPLTMSPQNKILPEPDQRSRGLTSPDQPNQDIRNHTLDVSVQTDQELWQEISLQIGQKVMTLIGQDCRVTLPLILDTKDTPSSTLDHYNTSPRPDYQAENIPDPNIQFTLQGEQDSGEEKEQKTQHQTAMLVYQSHGIIPPSDLDPQDKDFPASDSQDTTLRGQDYEAILPLTLGPQNKALFELGQQVKDTQSYPVKDLIQIGQAPCETMIPGTDHQVMAFIDQDPKDMFPMHLDAQDKPVPSPYHQASPLTGQDYGTTSPLDLGVQDETLLEPENWVKPLPHSDQLAEETQGQNPQVQTEQEVQEMIPTGTNDQTTILKGQDHGTTPPLALGPQNKALLEFDQQESMPPPFHHQPKDTQSHATEVSVQIEQEPIKSMPPREYLQATALIGQDHRTMPPVVLDCTNTSPTGLNHGTISPQYPNQRDEIIQVDLGYWDTTSQETNQDLRNLTGEDFWDLPLPLSIHDQETSQNSPHYWDTRPVSPSCQVEDMSSPKAMLSLQSEQDQQEAIELEDIKLTSDAIPLLASGSQNFKTLPLPDHQVIPQTDSAEDTPDSTIHACLQMVQKPLETPMVGKGQQAATPSDQNPEATPPLGFEEKFKDTLASNVHISVQIEQEPKKPVLTRKNSQAHLDQETTPSVGLDQNEILNGPSSQVLPSPRPSKQAEDTCSPTVHIPLHTEQEHWETIPPRMDNQNTTIRAQNNEAILSVNLDSQNTILPGSNSQMCSNLFILDQKTDIEDTQRSFNNVSLQTELDYLETMPPRIDHHNDTDFKRQASGAITPLSLDIQDKIPSGPNLKNTSKSTPDQQVEPSQNSNARVSLQIEPKSRETMPPRMDLKATSPMGQVNGSESLLSSIPQDANQSVYYHQDIIHPVNPNHKSEFGPDLQTHATAPSDNDHLSKSSESLDPNDGSQSRTELKPTQSKQNPWCFKYIISHAVGGRTIPTGIIHTIINSIPQERIKNDISKQILLKRMRVYSALRSGRRISSSYPICLICASWIPDGCPHVQKMKYLCEAQLLAIPTPLPGPQEDMGVKFVLQAPQIKRPTFILPNIPFISQRLSYHSLESPPSSYSGSVKIPLLAKYQTPVPPSVPSKINWLNFIFGKDHQPVGRATFKNHQSSTSVITMKRYSSREDEPRGRQTFFRSLLERFQLRQRGN